jgi:hypothetical protein
MSCLLKTREDRFQIGADRLRQLAEGPRGVGLGAGVAAGLSAGAARA